MNLDDPSPITCLWFFHLQDDVEAEMKRLKLELKQTMDMYSAACREALTAKQKVRDMFHAYKQL